MISITIDGADRFIVKLGRIKGLRFLEPPMQRAVLRLQAFMAAYPPPPRNSKYRRTGTLGRRWTTEVTLSGGELTGKVGNNTVYGPLVQSRKFQAAVHRGRWQTDVDAIERNRGAIIQDFRAAIQRAI